LVNDNNKIEKGFSRIKRKNRTMDVSLASVRDHYRMFFNNKLNDEQKKFIISDCGVSFSLYFIGECNILKDADISERFNKLVDTEAPRIFKLMDIIPVLYSPSKTVYNCCQIKHNIEKVVRHGYCSNNKKTPRNIKIFPRDDDFGYVDRASVVLALLLLGYDYKFTRISKLVPTYPYDAFMFKIKKRNINQTELKKMEIK